MGRIGLIDSGMVGMLDPHTREASTEIFVPLPGLDPERFVEAAVNFGIATRGVDRGTLAVVLECLRFD